MEDVNDVQGLDLNYDDLNNALFERPTPLSLFSEGEMRIHCWEKDLEFVQFSWEQASCLGLHFVWRNGKGFYVKKEVGKQTRPSWTWKLFFFSLSHHHERRNLNANVQCVYNSVQFCYSSSAASVHQLEHTHTSISAVALYAFIPWLVGKHWTHWKYSFCSMELCAQAHMTTKSTREYFLTSPIL